MERDDETTERLEVSYMTKEELEREYWQLKSVIERLEQRIEDLEIQADSQT